MQRHLILITMPKKHMSKLAFLLICTHSTCKEFDELTAEHKYKIEKATATWLRRNNRRNEEASWWNTAKRFLIKSFVSDYFFVTCEF